MSEIKSIKLVSNISGSAFLIDLKTTVEKMQNLEKLDVDIQFAKANGLQTALVIGRARYKGDE